MKTKTLANLLLGWTSATIRVLPGGIRHTHPRNVLVIRRGNLGDIIVALPAFHALRRMYTDARFTLLTSPTKRGAPSALDVLENDRTFDEMIVYYEDESSRPGFLRSLRKRIRSLEIDFAVALPNHMAEFSSLFKYQLLLATAGVRRMAGFRLVRPQDYEIQQVDRLMELIRPLGAVEVEPVPWLVPSDEDRDRVRALLAECGDRVLVGMHCGAKRPANRWPAERFADVGRRLMVENNVQVVLTGGPGDRDVTAQVAAAIGPGCLDLAGQTTIGELAAVAEQCRLFVSNDTGVMHVAEAVGTPVVAIFGGRFYPNIWYPYGDRHIVLRKDDGLECRLCEADVCPRYDVPECLLRVSVEEVVQAAASFLGGRDS